MTSGTSAAQARLGVLEAVAAATLYGSSGIFAVELFQLGVSPISVALFRMLLGTAFLVIWALAFRRRELRLRGRDALILLVGGPLMRTMLRYQSRFQWIPWHDTSKPS